ncbi:MAG: ATPase, T2SS/T4P/T4SS family [Gammaproteobacteria bacterium]|nr:ATPase, T2SS/T4P/T4SS family [Gammaproteobacteria bacterium]
MAAVRERDDVARWPDGDGFVFPVERLGDFLVWACSIGASDVALQSARPAYVEVDGVLRRATRVRLDTPTLVRIVSNVYGATGEGVLRSGHALDCSHEVRGEAGRRHRFRVNVSAVQVRGAFGINVTLRVLPGIPPELEALGVEPEVVEACLRCRGLTLVTGVPGSGKSTLLAAVTRRLLERGVGRIQSYEAPIEFVFDEVDQGDALMSASEIPVHFGSFAEGLRSSLRRRPSVVVVGEARDRETVEAVVHAADFGIAVFSTAHTVGVAQTLRRMVVEFRPGEREERAAALVDLLNVVVTQVLVPAAHGGRTALREWLVFERAMKDALLELPLDRWAGRISAWVEARGQTMAQQAERAFEAGRIRAAERMRLAGRAREDVA